MGLPFIIKEEDLRDTTLGCGICGHLFQPGETARSEQFDHLDVLICSRCERPRVELEKSVKWVFAEFLRRLSLLQPRREDELS